MTAAEGVKTRADLAETKANTLKLVAETEHLELETAALRRTERAQDARVLYFVADVEELEIDEAIERLHDWSLASRKTITVRLCSPGGSVFHGLLLYDLLRNLSRSGIKVVTEVYGYGASMGAIISQAGTVRRIAPSAWFMVHEPSTIVLGKTSDIKDEAALMKRLNEQGLAILAERSNMTAGELKRRTDRKDWWMTADEALGHGFFDEVI